MGLAAKNEHDEDEDDEDDDTSTCGQSSALCLVDFERILRNLRSVSRGDLSSTYGPAHHANALLHFGKWKRL